MRTISFGVGAVALVAGCGLTDPDQSVILGVSQLDAPSTVASGSPITAVLTVTLGGCLSFDHIQVDRDANSAHIIVWGNDSSKGIKASFVQATLRFSPTRLLSSPPSQTHSRSKWSAAG